MTKSCLKLYFRFYNQNQVWGNGLDWKYFTLNYEDYHCEKYGSNYYKLVDTPQFYDFLKFLTDKKYIEESHYRSTQRFGYKFSQDYWLEVDGKKCRLLKGDIANKESMIKEKEFEVSERIIDHLDKNLKDAKEKIESVFEYF